MAFTAMAGARNAAEQLAVTTHNLANAATPGFREQIATFRAVPVLGEGAPTRISAVDATPGFSAAAGRIEATGNPFDLALAGDGWFTLQRADGSVGYSRAGRLTVDAQGVLRGAGGAALMGDAGVLRLPAGSVPVVGGDGVVFARRSGEVDGVRIGQLRLARADPGQLDRGPDGLFQAVRPLALAAAGSVQVHQGATESSNVSVSDAMVLMISQSRLFDLSMQLVRNADQNARSASALVAGR